MTDTHEVVQPDHEVVVIGAGFSGIGVGIKLKMTGIDDFVILDRGNDFGGTWRDNTYPGVAVDVSTLTYSFSFEPNPNWSNIYPEGPEINRYALHCADKYALRPHARFGTNVAATSWDDRNHLWRIDTADGKTYTARYMILGPGGLSEPKLPDIEGIGQFTGTVMHSARWDNDFDLSGKRVAVIGTGASGVQIIPSIADEVERLDVYQRTPVWIIPRFDLPIPAGVQLMFRHLPATQRLARAGMYGFVEVLLVLALTYNKQLKPVVRAVEKASLTQLRLQVRNPEIREKLTPRYGFGCKRPCLSNVYFPAFNRANVELITEPIQRFTPTGIVTADGIEREVDVLVCATGFKIFEKGGLPPFEVHGRDGVELGTHWDENRYEAFLGASITKFPNSFLTLGPYGFSGANFFQLVEQQSDHAIRVMTEARKRGATCAEIRQEALDGFMDMVMRRRGSQVFFNNGCANSNSYYFDHHGDVPLLRPTTSAEAWWSSKTFKIDNYRFRSLPEVRATKGVADAASIAS